MGGQSLACKRGSAQPRPRASPTARGGPVTGTTVEEHVLVEGLNDKAAVEAALGSNVSFIVTHGSYRVGALRHKEAARHAALAKKLRSAHSERGILVLVDPDFEGRRMRTVLDWLLPGGCRHAFLSTYDALAPGRTAEEVDGAGVEHASSKAIRRAIANPREFHAAREDISRADLEELGLAGPMHDPPDPFWRAWGGVSARRKVVARMLGFGDMAPLQLQRWLNRYGFSRAELRAAVEALPEPSRCRELAERS